LGKTSAVGILPELIGGYMCNAIKSMKTYLGVLLVMLALLLSVSCASDMEKFESGLMSANANGTYTEPADTAPHAVVMLRDENFKFGDDEKKQKQYNR
jgi:hypothetical protein